jgi:hypothetical protein
LLCHLAWLNSWSYWYNLLRLGLEVCTTTLGYNIFFIYSSIDGEVLCFLFAKSSNSTSLQIFLCSNSCQPKFTF